MNSMNKRRAMLVSCAVILLCMAIIGGMTFALFTDRATISNHLQAGDLQITLKRTELVKKTLNDKGYLVETTVQKATDTPVDFSAVNSENVFGIETAEKIVPGTKYTAKMKLENGSDVAFGYWIQVVCTDKTDGADLAKQLKVTVNTGSDSSAILGDGLTVKGANGGAYIGEIAVGASASFTVSVEFLDSAVTENDIDENNLAKNEKLSFDLIVYAVQATK